MPGGDCRWTSWTDASEPHSPRSRRNDLEELLADLPPAGRFRPAVKIPAADFWSLEPKDRASRLAILSAPAAAIFSGGVFVATFVNGQDDVSMFAGGVATGVLGYLTDWALSRTSR